jgi:hypothetical protein
VELADSGEEPNQKSMTTLGGARHGICSLLWFGQGLCTEMVERFGKW